MGHSKRTVEFAGDLEANSGGLPLNEIEILQRLLEFHDSIAKTIWNALEALRSRVDMS